MRADEMSYAYVFVDFFDTIVHRKISTDLVKQNWAKKVVARGNLPVRACELYRTRLEVEVYLTRNKVIREYSYEDLCQEMYHRLIVCMSEEPCRYDYESIRDLMIAAECQVEKENLVIDKNILQIIKKYWSNGAVISILSDFYMGEKYLEEYLKYLKIRGYFSHIYVSCDLKRSKSRGDMYEFVLQDLRADAARCLMIGDNLKSDVWNARRCKIHTSYTRCKKKRGMGLECEHTDAEIKRIYKQQVHNLYDGFAFDLYHFIDALYICLKREHVKHVFFLSREGEFLKSLFDTFIQKHERTQFSTYYLKVSRKSTFLASMDDIEKEEFNVLFKTTEKMGLCTFLSNLLFEPEEIEAVRNHLNISEMDFREEADLKTSLLFKRLKNDAVFRELYDRKRRYQREHLLKYMESFHVDFEQEGLYLVDVGWKGSIQDNLFAAMRGKAKVYGYYLGLTAAGNTDFGNQKLGLLFSIMPCKSKYYDLVSSGYLLYEDVLTASHPSVKEYAIRDNQVIAVYDVNECENGMYALAHPVQIAIQDIIAKLDDVFWSSGMDSFCLWETFVFLHLKSICKVNGKTIAFCRKLDEMHYENFGPLKSQKELQKERKKEYLQKYMFYLKMGHRLFQSVNIIRVATQLQKAHMGILIPVYARIAWLYGKYELKKFRKKSVYFERE